MRRRGQSGFTIIEIMIVVTIISVIASIAIPAMRVNTVRVKLSEAILAFAACRTTISEIYQSDGQPPADGVWNCEVAGGSSRYVNSIRVDAIGKITISLQGFTDGRLDTKDLTLQPLDNTGNVPSGNGAPIRTWRCGAIADGTEIAATFLPNSCRGS
jgi:type IV pilus assembly protein PilA